MVNPILERELHQHLEHLMASQQRQVLDFARTLAAVRRRGVAGTELIPFAGSLQTDDIQVIVQAIKDCEKVDTHEW